MAAAGNLNDPGWIDLGRYPPKPGDGEYYDDYYLKVLSVSSPVTKVAVTSEGKSAGLTSVIVVDCALGGLQWLGLENFDTRPNDTKLTDMLPEEIRRSLEQKACRR